jgi:hypothetical protein
MKYIKQLSIACGQRFAFLTAELGFRVIDDRIEDWGFEKRYRASRVGVVLHFEVREFYLFVRVARLSDGKFPPRCGEIRMDSDLNTFDLDDIVALRASQSLIPQYGCKTRFDPALFEQITNRQAENLRLYAGDILEGDFSSFVELEKIVKSRARDAAIQKWEAISVEFGWKL